MSCKFVIWKKFKNGLFSKTNFTKTKVKALLAGKTVTCKKLISLRGDEFEADVKLNVNPAGKHGPAELKVVFPDKKGNSSRSIPMIGCPYIVKKLKLIVV